MIFMFDNQLVYQFDQVDIKTIYQINLGQIFKQVILQYICNILLHDIF